MTDFKKEARIWNERKNKIFEDINSNGAPLVLFGKAPSEIGGFLRKLKVPVLFICDNDKSKHGSSQWGLKIVPADELEKIGRPYNVLILVPFEHEIIPQLNSLNSPPENIYRLDLYFEEKNPGEFFKENRVRTDAVRESFADPLSKETLDAVIKYRVNRDVSYLEKIAFERSLQYFPDALDGKPFLNGSESFADAGAFIGDTIEGFLKATDNRFNAIYAFEPERNNFERLKNAFENYPDIYFYNIAVGDEKKKIFFMNETTNSKAADVGEEVQMDTLDNMLRGKDVTFIKMDVEGAECAALRGAENIIKAQKPKLAICAYHSDRDMLEVPETILKIRPDYKLYLRHYSKAVPETICYAV